MRLLKFLLNMIYAKKHFGQHFLRAQVVIDAIVNAVPSKEICEIGPGLGALTEFLLLAGKKVTAIEIDRDCMSFLQDKFADYITSGQLLLHQNDALQYQYSQPVVGNLPYNISTQLISNFVYAPVPYCVFMVQKEVAERIRSMNRLGAFVQARYDVTKLIHVPPSAFVPRPQVDSTVLIFKQHNRFPQLDYVKFDALLKEVFAQPRKMLSSLKRRPDLLALLTKSQINLSLRPADLTLEEYVQIISNAASHG